MRTKEPVERLPDLAVSGWSLCDVDAFGESAIAAALRTILDPDGAESEAVAAFENEGA
ncbi:FxSxx-COOH cyclophane-containing RiPP peptide [Nocardiopsis dassonvillei]|uniref:FxSxx-COOH cyclophane-containing RiPP peptide n=1 Tax=Nocardiopsis dassonvillei TaxID=2014 RepID=UPI003F56A816